MALVHQYSGNMEPLFYAEDFCPVDQINDFFSLQHHFLKESFEVKACTA